MTGAEMSVIKHLTLGRYNRSDEGYSMLTEVDVGRM